MSFEPPITFPSYTQQKPSPTYHHRRFLAIFWEFGTKCCKKN
eukprot:UN11456